MGREGPQKSGRGWVGLGGAPGIPEGVGKTPGSPVGVGSAPQKSGMCWEGTPEVWEGLEGTPGVQ